MKSKSKERYENIDENRAINKVRILNEYRVMKGRAITRTEIASEKYILVQEVLPSFHCILTNKKWARLLGHTEP